MPIPRGVSLAPAVAAHAVAPARIVMKRRRLIANHLVGNRSAGTLLEERCYHFDTGREVQNFTERDPAIRRRRRFLLPSLCYLYEGRVLLGACSAVFPR